MRKALRIEEWAQASSMLEFGRTYNFFETKDHNVENANSMPNLLQYSIPWMIDRDKLAIW